MSTHVRTDAPSWKNSWNDPLSFTLRNVQIANALVILITLVVVLWPNSSWDWALAVSVITNAVLAAVRLLRFLQLKRRFSQP